MYVKILFKFILALVCIVLSESTSSIGELKSAFGSKICIEGSLSTFTTKSTEALSIKELNSDDGYAHLENASFVENNKKSGKSAQSELAELAQYNAIEYFFKLEKEEGPPHNKIFTVSLTLGDEKFISEGTSLKKAKENLASIALENTEYEKPPIKNIKENEDALTPTVLLNNLSAGLGIKVTYFIVNKEGKYVIDKKPKKTYLQKLNESLYSDNDLHIKKGESQTKGPFNAKVQVGDDFFYGTSHTIQSARHEAASKAVDHLIKQMQEGNSACLKEGLEEQCKQAKNNLKSPISLVYEAAQLRHLEVEFEIISESGPPHKKVFVTRCRLEHLSTEGEGSSKKGSKEAAALSMSNRISELPSVSRETQVKHLLKHKKSKTKKKKKVLKTSFDMINMHIDNLVGSVLDFGSPTTKTDNENPTKMKKSPKINEHKSMKKSYQDEILDLANLLNFEIQFMDIDEKNQFYTLMSLHINPQHICLGQGSSQKLARAEAAKGGLKLLFDIGFETHFKDPRYVSMENVVKEKIHALLHQEIYESEK